MEGGRSWLPFSERQAGQECPASFGLSRVPDSTDFVVELVLSQVHSVKGINTEVGLRVIGGNCSGERTRPGCGRQRPAAANSLGNPVSAGRRNQHPGRVRSPAFCPLPRGPQIYPFDRENGIRCAKKFRLQNKRPAKSIAGRLMWSRPEPPRPDRDQPPKFDQTRRRRRTITVVRLKTSSAHVPGSGTLIWNPFKSPSVPLPVNEIVIFPDKSGAREVKCT